MSLASTVNHIIGKDLKEHLFASEPTSEQTDSDPTLKVACGEVTFVCVLGV